MEFKNTELPDIIELRNVCQSYGNKVVLENFNLLIEDKPKQGQFVVILGKSGSGKSTVLKYIAGLQKPTSGEILVNEKKTTKHVPMVFQQYSNIPWLTVLENVMLSKRFGVKVDKSRAMEIIEQVGLKGHEKKYASHEILSGGQLQRIAIARCLISNPDILLMDEPFGALDIYTRLQMQLLLSDLWNNMESTIVFVTHDISEAVFLGDDIYLMSSNPGKIVKRFYVDLPLERNLQTKRSKRFIELVNEVEDSMFELTRGS